MKKNVLVLLMFLLAMMPVWADEPVNLGSLDKVMNPQTIAVHKDRLYAMEGAKVFVYRLKGKSGAQFLHSFGTKGEGPGELKVNVAVPNRINVFPGFVWAQGFDKFIRFSGEGKVTEERKYGMGGLVSILPVTPGVYAVKTFPRPGADKLGMWSVQLYDERFKKIEGTELGQFEQAFPQQLGKKPNVMPMMPDTLNYAVYEEKIFVEKSNTGLVIDVFDKSGKRLYTIDKKMKPVKNTAYLKKIAEDLLKEDYQLKRVNFFVPSNVMDLGWKGFLKWATLEYPEFVPPIKDMILSDGMIYLQTYFQEKGLQQYIVMDVKGNNMKTVNLPVVRPTSVVDGILGLELRHYGFSGGMFYYLQESKDEDWQLFAVPVTGSAGK